MLLLNCCRHCRCEIAPAMRTSRALDSWSDKSHVIRKEPPLLALQQINVSPVCYAWQSGDHHDPTPHGALHQSLVCLGHFPANCCALSHPCVEIVRDYKLYVCCRRGCGCSQCPAPVARNSHVGLRQHCCG